MPEAAEHEIVLLAAPRERNAGAQMPRGVGAAAGPERLARAEHDEHERTALRVAGSVFREADVAEHLGGVIGECPIVTRPRSLQADDSVKLGDGRIGRPAGERVARQIEVGVDARGRSTELELDAGECDGDRGLALDELFGQPRQQRAESGAAARQHHVEPALAREIHGETPLLGCDCVPDRVDVPFVVGMPARGARVQLLAVAARPRSEPTAQQLEEQAVIAVPLAPVSSAITKQLRRSRSARTSAPPSVSRRASTSSPQTSSDTEVRTRKSRRQSGSASRTSLAR